ncbi:MAG: TetR/AcrR family transcriptional regulator [Caulobacterales bacterium]
MTKTTNTKKQISRSKESLSEEIASFKKEKILAEAANLFFDFGYARTSVQVIAEGLGVTKPFVYYHFENKLALLSEICQRGTKEALSIAERALSSKGTPSERLFHFVEEFTASSLINYKYVTIFFRESIHLSEADADAIKVMRKEIDRKLTELLVEGINTGEFDIEDPILTGHAITGMASFPFSWYGLARRPNKESICRGIAMNALKMVQKASAKSAAVAYEEPARIGKEMAASRAK